MTASETVDDDKEWLRNDRKALVDAGFDVSDYTITDKKKDQIVKDLGEYSYIYISGGDTPYLLEQSKKSSFSSLVGEMINKEGKTYIGTSAGSIIAGPYIPEYLYEDKAPSIEERRSFGLVNFTIVPHWGSEYFKDRYLNKRLEIAYKDDQVPLILLTDYQYVHVETGSFKIIDVQF